MIDEAECMKDTAYYKVMNGQAILDSFYLNLNKNYENLKNHKGSHVIFNFKYSNIQINRVTKYSTIYLLKIPNINIIDEFQIMEFDLTIKLLFKIRLMDVKEYKVNFFTFSIISTTTLKSVPFDQSKYDIINFKTLSFNIVKKPFTTKSILSYIKYYCQNEDEKVCRESFLAKFPLKNNNQMLISENDEIFDKDIFEGVIETNEYKHKIKYKLLKTTTIYSVDYRVDNSMLEFPNKNINECEYIEENGLLNIKCTCQPGFFGLYCIHKIYNYQTNCQMLKMCGLYGRCTTDITKNECICLDGWGGKYCTKSLLSPTYATIAETIPDSDTSLITTSWNDTNTITLEESKTNTSITNITTISQSLATEIVSYISVLSTINANISKITVTNNKISKIEIALAVTFGIIILILIMIGAVIYFVTNKMK